MSIRSLDTFRTRCSLHVEGDTLEYFSLPSLEEAGIGKVSQLPFSLRVLLENLLRNEDGRAVTKADIEALANWDPSTPSDREIAFSPARVILQDFTGVPAVVDLAVMRDAVSELGGNPARVNPHVPAELVIDHSVQVDLYGRRGAFEFNVDKEFERNQERYEFLRWGQSAFDNFKVVPPATGIVHQVNLEYLARVVFESVSGAARVAFFDTLVGTDSHTTMINGLGVLGWGVGGIEAEAAMLGQPISLLIPQVVGFRLLGSLPEGATATDMVLTITQMLRKKGVVGKFVEFFGPGVTRLTLADRATIGNMSPEYGATCAIFPIDQETLSYLNLSARSARQISLVEAYSKAQGLFHTPEGPEPVYSDLLQLDLGSVEPSLAGPRRPQDRIVLAQSKAAFNQAFGSQSSGTGPGGRVRVRLGPEFTGDGEVNFEIGNGAIVIAAITSCTNTSNPSVMIAAGLVARKAVEKGLARKPWVKSSLAPGSKVVTEYLEQSGLSRYLDELGFQLVGYGCTTCIGNSGPLPEPVSKAIRENNVVACAVLSGNRNFEGRINPDVRANYLASPPLVVAYSLAGRMDIDLLTEALGYDTSGREVYLKDIWPTQQEIQDLVHRCVTREMFASKYADVFTGDPRWQKLPVPLGDRYEWDGSSTYIRKPTFFENITRRPEEVRDIRGMRLLALLGDSVTTDHISPAGSIQVKSPAGQYLIERGVEQKDFNSYGSRRGNHEVMVRGTFANIRLRNLLVPGVEGGYARHHSSGDVLPIYDVAMKYREEGVPLLIIAGKEYGSGSSRDWAAKGTRLLGVRAVIAESFERIHRSNLIGMGVLPCQFLEGLTWESLRLTGTETFDLLGLEDGLEPGKKLKVLARAGGSVVKEFFVVARVDTPNEVLYYQHGGILHYVLRSLVSE